MIPVFSALLLGGCSPTEVMARVPGSGGTFTVDAFENNVEIKSSFEVDFPGDDQIGGRFKAEHCNLEEFVTGSIL